jgi:hypothetical protein
MTPEADEEAASNMTLVSFSALAFHKCFYIVTVIEIFPLSLNKYILKVVLSQTF